jgi:hypothetical protein
MHASPRRSSHVCRQTACVTAWITVSVAVERYICVCHATRYRTLCTVQRAAVVVVIVFVSMSLLAAPSAFRYRTSPRVVAVPVSSTAPSAAVVNRTFYEVRPTGLGSDHMFVVVYYHWTLSLIRSVVPLILLTVLNIRVVCAVWSRPSSGEASRAVAASAAGRRSAQNRSITAMLALVVVVFAVCIVPDAVMSVVFGVGYVDEQDQVAKGVRELTDALLALSSAVNFIVYCLCSRRFRAVLIDTLYGGRRREVAAFDDLVVADADDGAMAADDGDAAVNDNSPCSRRHSRRKP